MEKVDHNRSKASRLIRVLKKSWRVFLQQPWRYKLVFAVIFVLTTIIALVFFTGWILWKLFCLITLEGLLGGIEWLLDKRIHT